MAVHAVSTGCAVVAAAEDEAASEHATSMHAAPMLQTTHTHTAHRVCSVCTSGTAHSSLAQEGGGGQLVLELGSAPHQRRGGPAGWRFFSALKDLVHPDVVQESVKIHVCHQCLTERILKLGVLDRTAPMVRTADVHIHVQVHARVSNRHHCTICADNASAALLFDRLGVNGRHKAVRHLVRSVLREIGGDGFPAVLEGVVPVLWQLVEHPTQHAHPLQLKEGAVEVVGVHCVAHARLAHQQHGRVKLLGHVCVGQVADGPHTGVAHAVHEGEHLPSRYVLHRGFRLLEQRLGRSGLPGQVGAGEALVEDHRPDAAVRNPHAVAEQRHRLLRLTLRDRLDIS
eukprot:Colp12_sorted_trinity150504_noHs@30704